MGRDGVSTLVIVQILFLRVNDHNIYNASHRLKQSLPIFIDSLSR